MIADMHCDTLYRLREERKNGRDVRLCSAENFHVNLDKMCAGDYMVQNFAVFIDMGEKHDPYEDAMELVQLFEEEMCANQDRIRPVTTSQQVEENHRQGMLSAMLTLEEGGMCEGDIEKLEEFYRHGARMMTLTWNYENELASPATPILPGRKDPASSMPDLRQPGLKKKGFEFVEAMEALGMIPDVSHLSDAGFYDICRTCRKPFVASHSNARALCGHARNLTDDMLRELGNHGGVAGLNYYPEFLDSRVAPENSLKQLAAHALHMTNCGGMACVGLGSDFDGFHGDSTPAGADRVKDLAWAFHQAGFSDSEIEGIFYRNVMRVYRDVLL